MTNNINLSTSLAKIRKTHYLKVAVTAFLLLWYMAPQQAVAGTYERNESNSIQQQKVKTTGTVKDEVGEPLIGVSVKIENSSTGTITDLDGKFSLDAPKGSLLEFSFIGYKVATVKVDGRGCRATG